jgi:hypothetical protein
VVAKGWQIETEAAPIRYVAAISGVADQETAIRWLIALTVLFVKLGDLALPIGVVERVID